MKYKRLMRHSALTLLILSALAVTLPLVVTSAHTEGRAAHSRRHAHHRHSRAWWRRYRARMRRRRAAIARQNALAAWRRANATTVNQQAANAYSEAHGSLPMSVPTGWISQRASMPGQMSFRIQANNQTVGEATLSVVAAASPVPTTLPVRLQRRTLGGVPLASLRRTVIDKMIASNGWVTNDLEREVNGHRVFIVLAQTAASSDGRTPKRNWTFYFTESDNRVYSLATNAPAEFAQQMTSGSEQVMNSLVTRTSQNLAETSSR
jgi:hypothetical protein